MMPRATIITPAILLIRINCFSLNFFLKILIVVVRVNHQVTVPRKTPQRVVIIDTFSGLSDELIHTAANRPSIRKSAPGLVIVITSASTKSSRCLLCELF